MAVEHAGWIKIDEVINTYLDRSEQGVHKFFKSWQICFDGMTQLGLDFFYQVKSIKIPISANRTFLLPGDFLRYSKVGVFNERGEVIPFKYNNKLTTFADLLPDRQTRTEDYNFYSNSYLDCGVFYNYWNGFGVTNLYGIPGGSPFVGDFKIDEANGVILLGGDFVYPYICLEYIASPEQGGEYYVPIQFKEALVSFIGWQDVMFMPTSRKGSLGDKEQRKKNYYNERRLANARYKPFYMDEAYESSLENQRLCLKA